MIWLQADYMEGTMKNMEIEIRLNPIPDRICRLKKEDAPKEGALFIGTNGEYRIIQEAEIIDLLSRIAGACTIGRMGKSDYFVVCPDKKLLLVDATCYLVGSALVFKKEDFVLKPLKEEEIEKAITEFMSRLVTLCGNGVQFTAYEVG